MENKIKKQKLNVGDVIKGLRRLTGATQSEMSKAINISQPALNKIENNINIPTINTLNKIADYFGVTTSMLLSIAERGEKENAESNELIINLFYKLIQK